MTAAFGASAAAILLILAAPAQAQEAGTSPATGTVATQPVRDTRPTTGSEPPKVDPKLLIDVINLLTRPRPAPPPAVTPTPATPEPVATPSPTATEPKPAAVAVAPAPKIPPPAVVPRAAPAVPASPRPSPSAAPAPPPAAAEEPLPGEAAPPAPPPAVTVTAQPAPPEPEPILEPATVFPSFWWLLGLLAAAAIAAASAGVQRARRIARTKAALSLSPRLDLSEGAGSTKGLALAGPAVAIRTRLEGVGAR